MFAKNSVWLDLREKVTFVAVARIKLLDWNRLDEASTWAERRWRSHGQKYRRIVRAVDNEAFFEFEHDEVTIEFLLKFG